MKRKILFFVMMIALIGLFTMQSCNEEMTSFTEYNSFTDPVVLAPADGAFVTVSGTTVELSWQSTDADGDTPEWEVYFGTAPNPPLVASGVSTTSYTVDVTKGNEYYWRVIITDNHGVITRSPIWSFSVVDPDAELVVDLSWDTDVATSIGLNLDPTDVVDLRLLIIKDSDKSIVGEEDGSSFEEYVDFNSLPDGDYLVATDIYSTIDAGDFNAAVSLDIELAFNQLGTIDLTLDYPQVMTNEFACNAYRTYLAKVTKVGSTYTITKDVSYMEPPSITWYGEDATYPSEVTTVAGCDLLMHMLGNGWMFDWWGETIVDGGVLKYTVDGSGNITIPLQYYCTTVWSGAEQTPYYIQGTGTLDNSGAFPVMILHYDFNQGGTWIGNYCFLHYGWTQDGFDADLTTDPAAAKGARSVARPAKPTR
jgi:hypothetical protein